MSLFEEVLGCVVGGDPLFSPQLKDILDQRDRELAVKDAFCNGLLEDMDGLREANMKYFEAKTTLERELADERTRLSDVCAELERRKYSIKMVEAQLTASRAQLAAVKAQLAEVERDAAIFETACSKALGILNEAFNQSVANYNTRIDALAAHQASQK